MANKTQLTKGIKTMGYTLILLFLAPFLLHQAFKNQDHPYFIPVLIVGIIATIAAIYFGFKGINTIVKALFDKS